MKRIIVVKGNKEVLDLPVMNDEKLKEEILRLQPDCPVYGLGESMIDVNNTKWSVFVRTIK